MTATLGNYRGSKEYLLVYCELIKAARYRGTTTYQAIADIMGLSSAGSESNDEARQMLDEISTDEFRNDRPLLSALAVGMTGLPGPEFFELARELGKLRDEAIGVERRFWEAERGAVYAAWRREFQT
jgi:hypothetical protein